MTSRSRSTRDIFPDTGTCVPSGAIVPVAVVKLGSSVVAHESGDLRLSVVARLCEDVARLHRAGVDVVVVTSGAIARGIRLLDLPQRPVEIAELQAASAVGQGRLYRTYDELLREEGLQTAQVLLTFFDMSARTHYLNARRTLRTLLGWRIVPVINENDTTTTDEISFGDNDFLAAQVAVLVGAELLVLLTDTAGLYTANPRRDPGARLVEEVREPTELEALDIGHEMSPLGSGGMRSKVVAAEMATAAGIPTVIASGFEPGTLTRAWDGERVGTRFAPQAVRHSSFKLWLKYAKPAQGVVTVDAGAARALREGGTSLLPVGIVDVAGEFEAGDAVRVHEAGAREIGKGIVNYSAVELRSVMGLKSAQIREQLPRATDEAVHRDYFVLA
jgi:glutamate 5-kinase